MKEMHTLLPELLRRKLATLGATAGRPKRVKLKLITGIGCSSGSSGAQIRSYVYRFLTDNELR